MNRAGLSFSLAVNSLSDLSMSELSAMRGRNGGKRPNNGLPFPMHLYTGVQVPDQLDWRLYGVWSREGWWSYRRTSSL